MDQEVPIPPKPEWLAPLENFDHLVNTGGPVFAIIVVLSVIALGIILFKLAEFWRMGLWRTAFIDKVLNACTSGRDEDALTILAKTRNPAARIMEKAILGKRRPALSRDDLQQDLEQDAAVRVASLRRHLRVLETIATLAPLLGLLGTVLGMIDAFQALESVGNRVDPSILSGGIWVALLTTAAGLTVAIPASAAYRFFESAIEAVTRQMESSATRILLDDGLYGGSESGRMRGKKPDTDTSSKTDNQRRGSRPMRQSVAAE